MKVKTPIKLFIMGLLCVLFYFLKQKEQIVINHSDTELIENFDLILSKGQSAQSKLVNLVHLSIKQVYTHIGIVCKEGNTIYVLHATPDGTVENCIRYDEFQTFINLSNVSDYQILRPKYMTKNIRQLLRIEVEKFKNSKIPFDYKFNNQEHNYIYCSELIYLMFKKTGLLNQKWFNLTKPIDPNAFINLKALIYITERSSNNNNCMSTYDIKH